MKRLLAALSVLGGIALVLLQTSSAYAATNYNSVVGNAIFDNANTMNAGQIDAFLNGFGSSCISTNNGFSAPFPTGYTPNGGFTYGGDVSAGRIIYDVSQAYGINPQVLLAILQKEQGLVRGDGENVIRNGTDCGALAISASMGYNCPDGLVLSSYSGFNLYSHNGVPVTSVSNTCVQKAAYVGFSRQIVIAAWQLTFDRHRAEGQNNWYVNKPGWDNSDDLGFCYSGRTAAGGPYYLCPDQNSHASDPFISHSGQYVIDGTVVTITNGATAAFYNYTPHLHGQDLFTNNFTSWFGPTNSVKLTGNPGSVSWGGVRLDVFVRGTDGMLWQKYYDGSSSGWSGWAPHNIPLNSSPAVASWGVGRLDLFYADNEGALQHYWYGGGTWQAVEPLGKPSGDTTIIDSPGAVTWASGRIDIFARGSDNALWLKTYDGAAGGWQPWLKIGGIINSAPTVSTWGTGRLDVFATGPAGDLEHFWYSDNTWHLAETLGQPSPSVRLTYAPGAVSWGAPRIDVFGRGSDGVLWQKWFDATGWHPWVRFNGVLNSAPSMSTWGPQRLDEFSTGAAGDLQHYWFSQRWGNWESFGQPVN